MCKLTKLFLFCAVAGSLFLFSCNTTKSNEEVVNTEQIQKNKEAGLPLWANCEFSNATVSSYIPGYNGEAGLYASCDGSDAVSARLKTRSRLYSYCVKKYGSKETDSANGTATGIATGTLYGSRIIDNFIAEDGTVYTLMFVSTSDAKKSAK